MFSKKITCFVLAAAMLCSAALAAMPVRAEAAATAEQQQKLEDSRAKQQELKQKLAEIKDQKTDTLKEKYLMDQRSEALQSEISIVNDQISSTQAQIEENEKREKEQYQVFCRQVRDEEERGKASYWSVLFKSTDFADLLSRVDFVNEIMEYDQSVISELRDLRSQLKEDKASLQDQKAELNEAQSELKAQIAEADELIGKLNSNQSDAEALLKDEQAAENNVIAAIKKAEEEERKKQEEERQRQQQQQQQQQEQQPDNNDDQKPETGGGGNSGVGGFIWPTNATRGLTSTFGGRASPGGIGSTNHQGVDIGAAYGTNILAAKSGTVIQAGWNGGYGYCVTINHGGGVCTLYGHMSSVMVSVGQSVSQGQVIGLVGSTGNSTGAHIHYGLYVNGVATNPIQYLPGYFLYG